MQQKTCLKFTIQTPSIKVLKPFQLFEAEIWRDRKILRSEKYFHVSAAQHQVSGWSDEEVSPLHHPYKIFIFTSGTKFKYSEERCLLPCFIRILGHASIQRDRQQHQKFVRFSSKGFMFYLCSKPKTQNFKKKNHWRNPFNFSKLKSKLCFSVTRTK